MKNTLLKLSLLSILAFIACAEKKTRVWIDTPMGMDAEKLNSKNLSYHVEDVNQGKKENLTIPVNQIPDQLVVQTRKKSSTSGQEDGDLAVITQADQQIRDGKLTSVSPDGAPKISYLRVVSDIESLYLKKHYSEALVKLAPLIEQYPKQTKLFVMQGTLFKKIGENKLALDSYKKAKELEPNNASIEESILRVQAEVGSNL